MTIKELIERLQAFNPDAQVIIGSECGACLDEEMDFGVDRLGRVQIGQLDLTVGKYRFRHDKSA